MTQVYIHTSNTCIIFHIQLIINDNVIEQIFSNVIIIIVRSVCLNLFFVNLDPTLTFVSNKVIVYITETKYLRFSLFSFKSLNNIEVNVTQNINDHLFIHV